jgi:hypothetical protein
MIYIYIKYFFFYHHWQQCDTHFAQHKPRNQVGQHFEPNASTINSTIQVLRAFVQEQSISAWGRLPCVHMEQGE